MPHKELLPSIILVLTPGLSGWVIIASCAKDYRTALERSRHNRTLLTILIRSITIPIVQFYCPSYCGFHPIAVIRLQSPLLLLTTMAQRRMRSFVALCVMNTVQRNGYPLFAAFAFHLCCHLPFVTCLSLFKQSSLDLLIRFYTIFLIPDLQSPP